MTTATPNKKLQAYLTITLIALALIGLLYLPSPFAQTPSPPAASHIVPLGASTTNGTSSAWYYNARTNQVVVCIAARTPSCSSSAAP
jgi:hypothetical protein